MIDNVQDDISRYYGDTKPVNDLDRAEGRNGGQVYFISDGASIKIGYSSRAIERMSTLQGATPRALKLLGAIPGTMKDEQRLHTRFRHLWIRGEWFRSSPDLLHHIARVCDPRAAEKDDAARIRIEFKRWASGRPEIDRNLVWVIDRQIMIAATCDSPALRGIISENLNRACR